MPISNTLKAFVPDDSELALINSFTRRSVTSDELYTFSVILCDNEIDRDNERFSVDTLKQLSTMFVGKTGIFDHVPSGQNQTARVYFTEIISDKARLTSIGEPYTYIYAKAYMMKTDSNKSLMLEIDGGIKKEVSISCSIRDVTCSICNANVKISPCVHHKGKQYGKSVCYHLLSNATDAYEWSFVAVPAQRNAGITKSFQNIFKREDNSIMNSTDIVKSLEECASEITITKAQADELSSYISQLKKHAQLGEQYRNDLIAEVYRLSFLVNDSLPADIAKSVLEKMDINELKAYKLVYEKKLSSKANIQLSNACSGSKASAEKFKL